MKTQIISLILLLTGVSAFASSGHGSIPIQTNQDSTTILTYSIDTLMSYPVAPGVTYTHFTVTNSSSTRHCYLYDIDHNKNYPRTGFGITADHQRLFMLVMQKPGMYTHEMCSILRYFGASDAMGADGGGSAQFNLGGQIINPTTEGSPRAVSNAIFLFSTAPDDDSPATLLFHDNMLDELNLPSYSSYTPHVRAYNRYDMMIADDYPDFTLSCQPASLGTISDDDPD